MFAPIPRPLTCGVLLAVALSMTCCRPAGAQSRVVAHRGLLQHAPENTLANFASCLQLQIGFELDVQRSRDGHLVCIHDDTVDRTTDGKGRVGDLSLAQLRKLDAGSWFDTSFRGQRIPTIDEVFAMIRKSRATRTLIAVDLKGDDERIEHDTVRLARRHGVLGQLLFIGRTINTPVVRRRLRRASGKSHVAALAQTAADLQTAIDDPDSDWVYVRFVPTPAETARAHRGKKQVFIAGKTVSGLESKNWQLVSGAGVDGILTDFALPLAAQLRRKQAAAK